MSSLKNLRVKAVIVLGEAAVRQWSAVPFTMADLVMGIGTREIVSANGVSGGTQRINRMTVPISTDPCEVGPLLD